MAQRRALQAHGYVSRQEVGAQLPQPTGGKSKLCRHDRDTVADSHGVHSPKAARCWVSMDEIGIMRGLGGKVSEEEYN